MSDTKPKLIFMPGCFDTFEGTQEELDKLVAGLTEAFEKGELDCVEIDEESVEEEFPGLLEKIETQLTQERTLH